jgi:hypothetical protein
LRETQGLALPCALDERVYLRPPGEREAAVAARGTAAADVGFDHDDVGGRLELLDPNRRPETGVTAAHDADVGARRLHELLLVDVLLRKRLLQPKRTDACHARIIREPARMLALALFRKGRSWEPPAPRCAFLVSCAGALPELEHVIQTEGGGAVELEVLQPAPDADRLPDREIWPYIGLTDDLGRRVTDAQHDVNLVVTDPGASVANTVLEATKEASELAEAADGCVDDLFAMRFFGPEGWRVEDPLAEVDVREHVTLHTVPFVDGGEEFWVHTHGLVKFGRPEFEIYDVPAAMVDGVAVALIDMGQYVLSGALVSPGETLGDRAVPLQARLGERERDHWEDIPALELVDVDVSGRPAESGAERGLRAWWPDHFADA